MNNRKIVISIGILTVLLFAVSILSASVSASTVDSFNRTDANLDESEADNGEEWTASSSYEISSNTLYATGLINTDTAYLPLTDVHTENRTNISFEVSGIIGSSNKRIFIRAYDSSQVSDNGIRLVLGHISAGNSIYVYDVERGWVQVCGACIYDSTNYKLKIVDINVTNHSFNVELNGVLYDNGGDKYYFGTTNNNKVDAIHLGSYSSPTYTIDEITINTKALPCSPEYEEVTLVNYRDITYCAINDSLRQQKYIAQNDTNCETGLVNYTYVNRDFECDYVEPFHFNDYESDNVNWTGGLPAIVGHNSGGSYKIESTLAKNIFYNISENGSTRLDWWIMKTSHTGTLKLYLRNTNEDNIGYVWLNASQVQVYEEGVAKEVPFEVNVWYPMSYRQNTTTKNATFYFNDTLLSNNAQAYNSTTNQSIIQFFATDSSETSFIDDFRLFNEELLYVTPCYPNWINTTIETSFLTECLENETRVQRLEIFEQDLNNCGGANTTYYVTTEEECDYTTTGLSAELELLFVIFMMFILIGGTALWCNYLIASNQYTDFMHYIIISLLLILSAGVWISVDTTEIRTALIFVIALMVTSLFLVRMRISEEQD